VQTDPKHIQETITSGLQEVGTFIGADRALLCHMMPDRKKVVFISIWNSEEPYDSFVMGKEYDLAELPRGYSIMMDGQWRYINEKDGAPPESEIERNIMANNRVKSVLGVPIGIGVSIQGGLVFHAVNSYCSWSEKDFEMLDLVGQVFLNVLIQSQNEMEMRELNAQLENRVEERTVELSSSNRELEAWKKMIVTLSTGIAQTETKDIHNLITSGLRDVASFIGADRAFLCQMFPEKNTIIFINKWEGVESFEVFKLNMEVDISKLPDTIRSLMDGDVVYINEEDGAPPSSPESKRMVEVGNVKTGLGVPIGIGANIRGGLIFQAVKENRRWTQKDIDMLELVGQVFINVLIQNQNEVEMRELNAQLEQRVGERTGELREANEELEAFRLLLNTLSNSFVYNQTIDIRETITKALSDVANFIGADRALLLKLNIEKEAFTFYSRWSNVDVPPLLEMDREYEASILPFGFDIVANGQVFYMHKISELPDTAKIERQLLDQLDAKSVLAVPFGMGTDMLGALMFLATRKHQRWTGKQFEMLELVGNVFLNVLIQNRNEVEIRELNVQLEQRVEERTAELQVANQELESFSYSVSHDLRTPLRHIDGFIELLTKRIQDNVDEKGQQYLTRITGASRYMGRLIDDLLSFSRMARVEMVTTMIDPRIIITDIIHELSNDIGDRDVQWIVGELPIIHGDPSMLRQVFVNIMANALKFTSVRDETRIEVSGLETSDEVTISIKDNGVGFDPDYTHKLFGVFERLHSQTEFEGTGIGLANVKRIIHRHGGRVWADSKLDEGATFSFSLPQGAVKSND